MIKKEETNDIFQYLIPKLEVLGISREYCKIDVIIESGGKKRGDLWISLKKQDQRDFEENIIALIEAKHRKSIVGDGDWRDAMQQGKEKARRQKLNFYIITNCKSQFRFYNSWNDDEIILDSTTLTQLVPIEILQKIQTQVTAERSYVAHKSVIVPQISTTKFRETLKRLADIYRSAGLKKGEWNQVAEQMRDVELFKADMNKDLKTLLRITTNLPEDKCEHFTMALDYLYNVSSQFHHSVDKGKVNPIMNVNKEDAYFIYMFMLSITRLLIKKIDYLRRYSTQNMM
jgi:hypothetical protein